MNNEEFQDQQYYLVLPAYLGAQSAAHALVDHHAAPLLNSVVQAALFAALYLGFRFLMRRTPRSKTPES